MLKYLRICQYNGAFNSVLLTPLAALGLTEMVVEMDVECCTATDDEEVRDRLEVSEVAEPLADRLVPDVVPDVTPDDDAGAAFA